jgi:hypothetical protein
LAKKVVYSTQPTKHNHKLTASSFVSKLQAFFALQPVATVRLAPAIPLAWPA